MDRRGVWRRRLHLLERVGWAVSVLLGGTWVTARGLAWASERRSIAAFHESARAAVASPRSSGDAPAVEVDQSLWDARRVRAYARALMRPAPPPLALLRIPRLGLEAPVLAGTDEWTLDRAVGHIEGTARPGEQGNVGIAGHRDGFFRVLKDIAEGDVVELALPAEVRRFRVQRVSIVGQTDTHVLAASRESRLTLVTCYPFYFVGSAPRRFIVQARPE